MTKRVSVWKDVEVYVDPDDFETEDLCDILEDRGFSVKDISETDTIDNQVRELHRDFVQWGIQSKTFEQSLKRFFHNTIDKYEL